MQTQVKSFWVDPNLAVALGYTFLKNFFITSCSILKSFFFFFFLFFSNFPIMCFCKTLPLFMEACCCIFDFFLTSLISLWIAVCKSLFTAGEGIHFCGLCHRSCKISFIRTIFAYVKKREQQLWCVKDVYVLVHSFWHFLNCLRVWVLFVERMFLGGTWPRVRYLIR